MEQKVKRKRSRKKKVLRDEQGNVIIHNILNFIPKEKDTRKPINNRSYNSLSNTPEVKKTVQIMEESLSVKARPIRLAIN